MDAYPGSSDLLDSSEHESFLQNWNMLIVLLSTNLQIF